MSTKPAILIVDDEKNTRAGLSRALSDRYEVRTAENAAEALRRLDDQPADIVLADVRMPGMDGLTLLRRILARSPQPVCILLTAYGSIELAVEAMRQGAYDFLAKPVNLDQLDLILQRALKSRSMEKENRELKEKLNAKYGLESMVGRSPAMEEIFDVIRQVAPSRATVLIQGESGTGKELVAHAIHQLSPRAQGPFIPLNCAALSPSLLESELFGHEKGSFTGASEQRRGRFELADGGTIFLDEIGEIPAATQVKILRVLEDRRFERVGGQHTLEVDVRLLAATNRDLEKLTQEGKFRQDLFFRLNVVAINLPPLRERPGDIPMLVSHFLKALAEENNKPIEKITPDALEALESHSWPGNVRELRNVIEKMVVLARDTRLTLRDVPRNIRETAAGRTPLPPAGVSLQDTEKRMIAQSLQALDGNRTLAARQLGISRRTLHRKLNEYGLRENKSAPPTPNPESADERPVAE